MAGHVHVAANQLHRAFILALSILLIEVIGGFLANSLALLSDAAHMLTDTGAVALAWLAMRQGTKPPTPLHTFGFQRAGVLAALANATTLGLITAWITFSAYQRLLHPEPVHGGVMLIVAALGLIGNLYIGLGMRGEAHDLNVRAAMLHVLGDAAASAGVILSGAVIAFTGLTIVDPIMSFVIAAIIVVGAWQIARESLAVLMERAPADFDGSRLQVELMRRFAAIKAVHDLHVWQITSGTSLLSCHLVVAGSPSLDQVAPLLGEVKGWLRTRFAISHSTIEVELPGRCDHDCFCEDSRAYAGLIAGHHHGHDHDHGGDGHAHDHDHADGDAGSGHAHHHHEHDHRH